MAEKYICPECGKENKSSNIFCVSCGHELKLTTEALAPNTEAKQEIDLTIKLWTDQDLTSAIKKDGKFNLLTTAVGWVLMLTFGSLYGGKVLDGCAGLFGLAMIFPGLYLGIFQWFGIRNDSASWRKQARKKSEWFRDVKCATCDNTVKVNVGYLEFHCQECGVKNTQRASIAMKGPAGVYDPNPPEKIIAEGVDCASCKKKILLSKRPSYFECPNCKALINLEKIPV